MDSGTITTPFGRRSMTLGMLKSQMAAQKVKAGTSVDKWKLFRAVCEARTVLGVSDRALAVLNALLSFYPKSELSAENGLIVFPSNAQLSLRTHGMAEQTIRRHLASLMQAGLIIRKDSPNGKRYARKMKSGGIGEAFGFSLAPLLARHEEIEEIAASVAAARLRLQELRRRLTLARRDVYKLIQVAIDEGLAGNWKQLCEELDSRLKQLPKSAVAFDISAQIEAIEKIRNSVLNALENHVNAENESGNPIRYERHIQNSESKIISESERHMAPEHTETGIEANLTARTTKFPDREQQEEEVAVAIRHSPSLSLKSFPLSLVLQACPQITDYAAAGIRNWRDLVSASFVVQAMLGVSQSAYRHAVAALGPENTATVIACILERAGQISSAGGYLRDLTRRAERGEFAIGPMLMAQLRQNKQLEAVQVQR